MKKKDLESAVKAVMQSLDGAFSVTGMTGTGELFAFKDPHGIKPLCAGKSPDGKTRAFSSETVSLDINGFNGNFELEPGELVIASEDGFNRHKLIESPRKAFLFIRICLFCSTRLEIQWQVRVRNS